MANKLIVPQAQNALDALKMEIANGLGIAELNGDTTARDCGRVGGEMVRRLIMLAEKSLEQR